MSVKWHPLSEFIEVCNKRNGDLRYGVELIEGVNSSGEFCPPKACTDGIDLKPYKIVQTGDFVYNPSRINIGSLSYRTGAMCIVSHLYVVFHLTEKGKRHLLPEYLWLFFNREEFGRLVAYRNFGSQRPEFNFRQMCEVEVPVPPIDEQRKVVEAWQGLRAIKEQNEQLAAPLLALCRSYLQELKKTWPIVEIGPMIEESNARNTTTRYGIDSCRGVTSTGEFDYSRANLEGIDFSKYKVVGLNEFVYNPSRINLGSIALNLNEPYIVSPMYVVFRLNSMKLLPEFLKLWFVRTEFLRSTLFFASGSVRDTFCYNEMRHVKIPLPPLDIQQAVVDLYRCANEAKKIAAEADAKSREICPALMQWVVKKEGRDGESTEDRSARTCPTGEVPQTHRQRHSRFFYSNGSFKIRK